MRRLPIHSRVSEYSMLPVIDVLRALNTSFQGMTDENREKNKEIYGTNQITGAKKDTILRRLRRAFINPFSVVLFLLAVISLFSEISGVAKEVSDYRGVIVIFCMLILSGSVRFIQELRSKYTTDQLTKMIKSSVMVMKNGEWTKQNLEEVVVGDIVKMGAGDRIPADIRVISSEDCYVSQSVITGESKIQEKTSHSMKSIPDSIIGYTNILFLGTTIISGNCEGVVLAVGQDTVYGGISADMSNRKNGFDKGANSIAWVLIRFMAILVPIVFIASGLTKGDWFTAFLFALSVAVGLTPELLPMVVTACLAKGSYNMGRKQTVVKNINAMQGFGSMDVLCVDKTGTLTGDRLCLEYYMDILGNESKQVLDYAYLNSAFHSGVKNHIDQAVLNAVADLNYGKYYGRLLEENEKLDEIPFDYERKISSVLLRNEEETMLIVKGGVDEILKRCTSAGYREKEVEMSEDSYQCVHEITDEMQEDGMKVLAIAKKTMHKDQITHLDEKDLTLLGYIAFFDAPKKSAVSAIAKLHDLNVKVKVLTGDNLSVAVSVCKRLNIDVSSVMTGSRFESLSDNETQVAVENTTVFAELSPKQKSRIIALLQSNGHTVGFLADGINDLPAMLNTDVGISVDTASPAIKEAADVILLKKDLNVLEEGILEGRRAFVNMSKYIKITASSNLGNIIAIVVASIFLPFFPMTSIQLLLLNLLYDMICLVLPWDRVDFELCEQPLEWTGNTLSRFMLFFGPISSLFDLITFGFLMLYFCPMICGGSFASLSASGQNHFISLFQTGWFIESMWTQVMILYLLRTKSFPLLQSRPSKLVLGITLSGIGLFTLMAMTGLGSMVGMTVLPFSYFIFLVITVMSYLILVTIAKKIYVRRYHHLI